MKRIWKGDGGGSKAMERRIGERPTKLVERVGNKR